MCFSSVSWCVFDGIYESALGDQDQTYISKGVSGDYESALDAAWKICCNEGPEFILFRANSGFARGFASSNTIPLYEQLKRYLTGTGLGSWNEEEDRPQIPGILIAALFEQNVRRRWHISTEVIRTRLQTQKGMVDTDSRLDLYHNRLQRDTPRDERWNWQSCTRSIPWHRQYNQDYRAGRRVAGLVCWHGDQYGPRYTGICHNNVSI